MYGLLTITKQTQTTIRTVYSDTSIYIQWPVANRWILCSDRHAVRSLPTACSRQILKFSLYCSMFLSACGKNIYTRECRQVYIIPSRTPCTRIRILCSGLQTRKPHRWSTSTHVKDRPQRWLPDPTYVNSFLRLLCILHHKLW